MKNELILEQREEISRIVSRLDINKHCFFLNKDKSTISREVSRKGMNRYTYRAFTANQHAKREKTKQGRKRKIDQNSELKQFIFDKLFLR